MADYGVYGVTIASAIPLALPESRGEGLVTIALRQVDAGVLQAAIAGTPLESRVDWFEHGLLDDGASYARWRGVGEFLVSTDGLEILCTPAAGVHDESFQVYLLGQAFSFALVKAGFEPLHATVVERQGNALALVGVSGQGKSTLAASFLAGGLRLVTDDLMLLSAGAPPLRVHPGPPRIKLLPDSAALVFGPEATRIPMNPETEKHVIPVPPEGQCREPAPLRGIYLLEHGGAGCDETRFEPLAGQAGFIALVAHTFNRYLAEPARLRRQLGEVTRVLDSVPVKRIVYPATFDRLAHVREALLADAGI